MTVLAGLLGRQPSAPHLAFGGVAIPHIFAAMNMHRVWGLTRHAKDMYARIANEEKGTKQADACVECGKCEEKCPQKIKIVEQLRETHEALRGD